MKGLRRKLFVSIMTLILVVMALGTSTFAWFSMNKTVTATGMQVTATAEGSLIIKQSTFPAATDGEVNVNFGDTSATALLASTHDSTWATYATGLKYVNNQESVSASTGLGDGLTYAAAVNPGSGTGYYKDYIVYIAAAGAVMEHQDLTISITSPNGVNDLNGAVSVDFYLATNATPTPSDATYIGALNLAGLDPETNNATATRTELVKSDITVPVADGSHGLVVLMRVYVDGALKDTANTTFVKTIDITEIADQTLSIQFVASTHNNG